MNPFDTNFRLPTLGDAAQTLGWLTILEHVLATIVVVLGLVALRYVIARSIRRRDDLRQPLKRRWLVRLRNTMVLLGLVAVAIIWAQEFRSLAVYLFAIAVATVIATKELIQCLTGTLVRKTSRSFHIGDRIEIGEFRGDVIDHSLLSTTIMEIGPDELSHRLTGRAITIPNSLLLSKPVVNECFTDDYVLHVFKVPMKMEDDWERAERDLRCAARQQCAPYLAEARRHFSRLSKREGLVAFSVDPHVTVAVPSVGTVDLIVRMAVPARQRGKVEQAVLRHFLALYRRHVTVQPAPATAEASAPASESPEAGFAHVA